MEEDQINDSIKRAAQILRHLRGELPEWESAQLEEWIGSSEANFQFYQSVSDVEALQIEYERYSQPDTAAFWDKVIARMEARRKAGLEGKLSLISSRRRRNWVVAASIFLVLFAGVAAILFIRHRSPTESIVYQTKEQDIFPSNAAPELVLADGTKILLPVDKDSSFTTAGMLINLSNSSLSYNTGETASSNSSWNTLYTPKGGNYALVLADGSRVWLNAASSIRYPITFDKNERRVELTGEAYFEVTKNADIPFRIIANDRLGIEVLGTSFNVNGYAEDDTIRTTLIDGKVRVNEVVLLPGQQALLAIEKDGPQKVKVINDADLEQVTAWKNGLFLFNRTPIREVMQQLERWYDVQATYSEGFDHKHYFTGEIDRQRPISEVLNMMNLTGVASFSVTNRTVFVSPAE